MNKKFERKTVFLYPNLAELSRDNIKTTSRLITNINMVVNSANDLIRRILASGNFAFINCLPTVLMTSVCENKEASIKCNNVRICISNYNDIDYTENYKQIITEYKNGCADISHLVAIHISDKDSKTQFLHDANENFDVIVKTNIDHLENILVSIMLDISLYHYFLLSNDLSFRKQFNRIKYDFIKAYMADDLKNAYGLKTNDDNLVYLPISLGHVLKLDRYSKETSRAEFIGELVEYYANFLIKVLTIKIERNERGSIRQPSNPAITDNYDAIEDFVRQHIDVKEYFIIVPDNVTEKQPIVMVNYNNKSNRVSTWIDKNFEHIGNYKILQVVEKCE